MELEVKPVKALAGYAPDPPVAGVLTFAKSDVFFMYGEPEDDGWARGEFNSKLGWFPFSYVVGWEEQLEAETEAEQMERAMSKYVEVEKEQIEAEKEAEKKEGIDYESADRNEVELVLNQLLVNRGEQTDKGPGAISTGATFLKSKIKKLGGTSTPSSPNIIPPVPSTAPPTKTRKRKLFGGVSLAEIKELEGNNMPEIVTLLCGHIVAYCIDADGLFRLSPDLNQLTNFIDLLEDSTPNSGFEVDTELDPAVPAGALKKFFRELDDPLLTFDHHDEFLAAGQLPEGVQRTLEMRRVVETLPEQNIEILKYLCKFLKLVSSHSDKNQMGVRNLGIVFGPTLLRSREISVAGNLFAQEVLRVMIDHYDAVFEGATPTPPAAAAAPAAPAAATPTPVSSSGDSIPAATTEQQPADNTS
eukprot:TRINITY_DN2482_c0_g1_i1.p1 TRINITY_DN2482_c0_g1~~TRINITY_DN2482_c0_g1_i1.p1  ORF type:complete len:416 (-),score=107.23 TRINITY_DN2482_c0_g1_i1:61-1308(-)